MRWTTHTHSDLVRRATLPFDWRFNTRFRVALILPSTGIPLEADFNSAHSGLRGFRSRESESAHLCVYVLLFLSVRFVAFLMLDKPFCKWRDAWLNLSRCSLRTCCTRRTRLPPCCIIGSAAWSGASLVPLATGTLLCRLRGFCPWRLLVLSLPPSKHRCLWLLVLF